MRKTIFTMAATAALIASPALAQSAGNSGNLLGGLLGGNNGSSTTSSASQSANSRSTQTGATSQRNDTTIGGISANPQLSYANSSTSSNANRSGGSGANSTASNSASGRTNSGSLALPLAIGSSTLGGGSNSFNRNTANDMGHAQINHSGRSGN